MMEHHRTWVVSLDGVDRHVDVVYAAVFGWMSIEVDGVRKARGWREVQTVIGGATLSCAIDGHRLEARITQPFGRQEYAMALAVDGALEPGSDAQPAPGALKRQTLKALGGIALVVAVTTLVAQLLRQL
jgi:hypothetical protein